ncbi:MAG: hypothetical protein RSE37_23255, partial [Citrobacter sp.]
SMEQEPVAYMHHSGQVVTRGECCDDKIFAICCKVETPLYATPPSPVVPDDLLSMAASAIEDLLEHTDPSTSYYSGVWADVSGKLRAAMLQGAEPVSEHDELPLDYLQGHKDGLEWAAQLAEANHPQTGDWLYDDPIELARAIRKGPDMPTSQDGNSPVTPDGWVAVPERPTQEMMDAFLTEVNNHQGYCAGYLAMLTAVPQQEVM